jgi:hypothetical protein
VDLIRVRLDYPALRRKVIEVYNRWQDPSILIEDAGSGISLLQDLYDQDIAAVAVKTLVSEKVGDERIYRIVSAGAPVAKRRRAA